MWPSCLALVFRRLKSQVEGGAAERPPSRTQTNPSAKADDQPQASGPRFQSLEESIAGMTSHAWTIPLPNFLFPRAGEIFRLAGKMFP